ncbi:NACHT domain-containing protein [Undibacterium umbellatum]|uniref:ATP-binding protein n=1 Tax=Undibacterium umbellatum TaxID=2762300 RepID=A0ABR6ZI99_9BURK|nr:hypothetical protein [Undibacterium umbellatum]MBC3911101.1 hypothetical protein [Undibacterium umbellatum]
MNLSLAVVLTIGLLCYLTANVGLWRNIPSFSKEKRGYWRTKRVTAISLDRRFCELRRDTDPESIALLRTAAGLSDGLLTWPDLIKKRRVVILAEAGSGKTTELVEQTRQQTIAGKYAFYATVQDVAGRGLAKAIRTPDRARYTAWLSSQDPAWFFIDSIDEAKLNRFRLNHALREIADGILGAEGRTHIVLSGRHTDWEFNRDATTLNEELPLPADLPTTPAPTLENQIRKILRHEKEPDPVPVETPIVVMLAHLGPEQIRTYATARNVAMLDELLAAIHNANIWSLARRPLDLEWIVRYWLSHGRLGSYTEMIETSLAERVRETDTVRTYQDSLDSVSALHGLQRVGAALVFGRQTTIAIPDEESAPDNHSLTHIEQILPDWEPQKLKHLLSRPAFDPATFGRTRLHNDNEGEVRAYLAAKWLLRLRQANLPQRQLYDLLFSDTHGIQVIKPSMQHTAAWLSLWDVNVANEVIKRDPFLLVNAGDPASLPAPIRRAVLTAVIERIRLNQEIPHLDFDSLKRFARPDIAQKVRTIWEADKSNAEIRPFILRLIALGKLTDCADIAFDASFGKYNDEYTAIMAGWALLETAAPDQKKDYAAYVKMNVQSLPATLVWDAIDRLFPDPLGIDDFVAILAEIKLEGKQSSGFNLSWNGADLAARLLNAQDQTRLINGLLGQLGNEPNEYPFDDDASRDAQYAPMLSTAAARLLALSSPDQAPAAAMNAIIRVGDYRFDRSRHRIEKSKDAVAQLQSTKERRRAVFWEIVTQIKNRNPAPVRPLHYLYQIMHQGWCPEFQLTDIEWLLKDAAGDGPTADRILAINTSLYVQATAGKNDEAILASIEAIAVTDGELHAAFVESTTPHQKNAEDIRFEQEQAEYLHTHKEKQLAEEQHWIEFVISIRNSPEQLKQLAPIIDKTVDSRIYYLWDLLNRATSGRGAGTVESLDAIIGIIGEKAAEEFALALSSTWRNWIPTLRSARQPDEKNFVSELETMCISGIFIESTTHPDWPSTLKREEAIRAAQFSTLHIGSLPEWISALATAFPLEVEPVLSKEIIGELDSPVPTVHYQILEYIYRGPEVLSQLVSPTLLNELKSRSTLNHLALRPILPILVLGLAAGQKPDLVALAIDRFQKAADPKVSAQYLRAVYAIDAQKATDALVARLDGLNDADKTQLAIQVLPQIFRTRWPRFTRPTAALDVITKERLVRLAFGTVRIEDDHDRANKGVYSPDARDEAEEARGILFNSLVDTPGVEAYAAIMRLAEIPDFPIKSSRLDALARSRAAQDAETSAWTPNHALQLEQKFEVAPKTGPELLDVALGRLADLQHELLHGDFQQGKTLQILPNEPMVQNWLAAQFRQAQGKAYSVEREAHVAGEKEPDIRLRTKVDDGCLSIEIKVAESWTLKKLEEALKVQLCGQYLRAQNGRYGILLLVHQVERKQGWELPDGTFIDFTAVVTHLQSMALAIREAAPDGPQPEIYAIDVSSCVEPVPKITTKATASK